MTLHSVLSLAVSLLLSVSAYAAFWACYYRIPADPVKVIDLRSNRLQPGRCISFCSSLAANPHGFPGHCYVAWSQEPPENFAQVESIGFVPEHSNDQIPSLWRDVPGIVIPHAALGNVRNLDVLCVLVDETQFERLHAQTMNGARFRFRVGQSDCVQYTHRIAAQLGLATPAPSYRFPQDYIRQLKKLNG